MIQVESWSQVVLWIFPWALVALWSKVLRPWNCLADHCQLCQWCIQYWSGSRLPHRPGEYKFVSFQCGYDFNMTLSMTFSMTCKCHVIKTFDCALAYPPRPDFECKLAERPPIAGLHKESGGDYQPRVDCTVIVRPWLTMMTVTRHCQWDNGQQHRQNNIGSV